MRRTASVIAIVAGAMILPATSAFAYEPDPVGQLIVSQLPPEFQDPTGTGQVKRVPQAIELGDGSLSSVRAVDKSPVPLKFYDRTDYNRNGISDQHEGFGPNPSVKEVLGK
jgi:hypothetical protein